MKYEIVTDIHEDLEALTLVIRDIKNIRVNEIICLGDVIGYNSTYYKFTRNDFSANKCYEILRQNNAKILNGNHDIYHLSKILKKQFSKIVDKFPDFFNKINNEYSYNDQDVTLSERNLKIYDDVKFELVINDIGFSHFLYPNTFGWYQLPKNHLESVKSHFKRMILLSTKIWFIGHLHSSAMQLITNLDSKYFRSDEKTIISSDNLNIVNCPPICRSQNNTSAYTIYDSKTYELYYKTVNL